MVFYCQNLFAKQQSQPLKSYLTYIAVKSQEWDWKNTLFEKSIQFNNYCSGRLCWPLFWYPNLEQESWQWTESASWTCLTHVWWYFPAVKKYLRQVMQCDLIIHFAACCQLTWLNRTNIAVTEQTLGVHWFLNALYIKDVISGMLRKPFLHRLLLERRRHLFLV